MAFATRPDMGLLLASICLGLAAVLGMVVAAVMAYFSWNAILWWYERRDQTASALSFSTPFEACGWNPSAADAWFGSAFAGGHTHLVSAGEPQVAVRPTQIVEADSPSPAKTLRRTPHKHHLADASGRRQGPCSPVCSDRVSCMGQGAGLQELLRGLAAQLALKFAGDLYFHDANVTAVAQAFELQPADVCYCFLCLEEASSDPAGGGLALKKWGTGQFAARVWAVALARFVKAAQQLHGAQSEERVRSLCEEWQYQHEHFVREVKACEVPFQRRHGRVLLMAFQQQGLRQAEVLRARHALYEHGMAARPRAKRLILEGDGTSGAPAIGGCVAMGALASNGPGPLLSLKMIEDERLGAHVGEASSSAKRRRVSVLEQATKLPCGGIEPQG